MCCAAVVAAMSMCELKHHTNVVKIQPPPPPPQVKAAAAMIPRHPELPSLLIQCLSTDLERIDELLVFAVMQIADIPDDRAYQFYRRSCADVSRARQLVKDSVIRQMQLRRVECETIMALRHVMQNAEALVTAIQKFTVSAAAAKAVI